MLASSGTSASYTVYCSLGSTLVVKRAQSYVVGSTALEAHEVTDHIYYVSSVEYALDGFAIDFLH